MCGLACCARSALAQTQRHHGPDDDEGASDLHRRDSLAQQGPGQHQRGQRANTPWVIVIVDKNGMPAFNYHCLDTADPAYAIASPMLFRSGKVAINVERVRRAREKIRR